MGCGSSTPQPRSRHTSHSSHTHEDKNDHHKDQPLENDNRTDDTQNNRTNTNIDEEELEKDKRDNNEFDYDNHTTEDNEKETTDYKPPTPKPPTPKPPTPKPPTPPPPAEDEGNEEDETPFDDDGILDSDEYRQNNMGVMMKSTDFRKYYLDEEPDMRPQADPGNVYQDYEFPLEIAIVQDNSEIEWKRPMDFVQDPQLFTDGSTRFDIGQGSAGTCWFLSTVANIADNEKLLKQVIPEDAYPVDDQERYDGVFHARFYRLGKWEDVYIDDYLPVIYGDVLWGAKSATDQREMWVALLEKAFAKMHGSYDAVYGGQPGDAYLQLTGGIGERLELEEHADKSSAFFTRIRNALNSGCQVGCVVPDEYDNHKGLVGGHAYSLVGVSQVGNTKLIRVRNPWGHGEWKGAWSDGSDEWARIPDNSVKAPNKDDGEFYVSLSDFMTYFSQTTICSLTPDFDMDGRSDSLNYVLNLYGDWTGDLAAGFHRLLQNPRFCFTVTEQGMVDEGYVPFVVQIVQQSKKRKTDNVSIRCDVFRVLGDKISQRGRCIALEIQGKKNNVYTPELQTTFRHRLKPGRYMIIPSTVDEGSEKAFLLRLFSPSPLENVKEISADVNVVSCEYEEILEANGLNIPLTFEKTLFGEFIAGMNAGGQVSHRESYFKNPQYVVTIPDTGANVPLVIHIMQTHVEPQYPVGLRLFPLDDSVRAPVGIEYLYDKYDNSPLHLEGSQAKFMISWDVDLRYMLPAGRYLAVVHMDQPDTEKPFSIVFKSNTHIKIKGHQTG